MMFLKFGKREHLEALKSGVVHFRPFDSFAQDLTGFRGDRLEGKLLYPKNVPLFFNGVDVSQYIEEASMSYVGFENILCFSLAILDVSNCKSIANDLYTPNDDFINEMKQFGDYFLIIPPYNFSVALNNELKKHSYYYKSQRVFYCNKSDHKSIREYFKNLKGHFSEYDMYCFTKGFSYSKQNEYRFIIDDLDKELSLNCNGGVNIKTSFFNELPIYETELLNTLQVSSEYLE